MINHPPEPDLDRIFHALSDASRRSILERLCERPWSVSALAEPFAMSLPGILQHLAVLESAGLVTSEKVGRVRTCRIVPRTVRHAESWLGARRLPIESALDRLDALLVATDPDAAPSPTPDRVRRTRRSKT